MRLIVVVFVLIVSGLMDRGSLYAQSTVDFKLKGYVDSVVYVGYHFGNQKYLLDTLEVKNEQFKLETDAQGGVYFLYSPKFYFEFILEEGDYSLHTSMTSLYEDLEVRNSHENELFKEFQLTMTALQKEQRVLLERLGGKDSLRSRQEMSELGYRMKSAREDLIAKNPETFVAQFIGMMGSVEPPENEALSDSLKNYRAYFYIKDHYFDDMQLSNSALLRTPLIHGKVMEYFDKILIQNPDSIIAGLDKLFNQIGANDEVYRYWLVTMFKKYAESKVMGMDAAMVHLAKNYYLSDRVDWISEEYRKQLKEEVAYLQHSLVGKQAPPIGVVVDTLMHPVYLEQISSPYTLLFIYDPDCGHCKKSLKELEKHDDDFLNWGIKVFALCTTTDVDRWKRFVSTANPDWIHAIDPTGKNYFRVYYNVRTTPQIYLLDADKTIVAKKLGIEQFLGLVKSLEDI